MPVSHLYNIMKITTLIRWHFVQNSSCCSPMLIISISAGFLFFLFFVFFSNWWTSFCRRCCFRAKVQRLLLSSVAYHRFNTIKWIRSHENEPEIGAPWTLLYVWMMTLRTFQLWMMSKSEYHIQMSTYAILLFCILHDYLTFQILYVHHKQDIFFFIISIKFVFHHLKRKKLTRKMYSKWPQ